MFVLCFSYRTSTSFGSPLISKIHVCEVGSLSQNGYGNGHMGQTETPTPRGVVGFVFLLVTIRLLQCAGVPRGTCNMWSLRCLLLPFAGVSNETCNTRIFLCCFLHCADVPSGMSSMPTVQQHLGCVPGPSRAVDRVRMHKSLTRTLCVVQSEMFNLRTPQWRLLLCAGILTSVASVSG